MTKLKIAHVKDHGVNVIIVPLAPLYDTLTNPEKQSVIDALQERASALGFNGRVVPVWVRDKGMRFIAPELWHPFFRRLRMSTIRANLNRELDFDDTQMTTAVTQDSTSQGSASQDLISQDLMSRDTTSQESAVQVSVVPDMRALLAQLDPQEKWPHELPKPSLPKRIAQWLGLPGF